MIQQLYRIARTYYAIASALIAASILGAAYTLEYLFDFPPCPLCLWQRYPYMAVIALGLIGSFFIARPHALQGIVLAIALAYTTAAGLGVYHTGVEYGVFEGLSGCSGQAGDTTSIEAMRAAILDAPIVSCSEPMVEFLGLSLAFWNALLGSLLALDAFSALWVLRKANA
jgi:disulfide bond formation protein DsbB